MSDFSDVRVGDRIWTVQLGEAEVVRVDQKMDTFRACSSTCTINTETYQFNGKWRPADKHPSAFWSRPQFEEPPAPKRMKKVTIERRIHITTSKEGFVTYTLEDTSWCPEGCIHHFDISHEFEVEE